MHSFTTQKNSPNVPIRMTIGWIEEFVRDGEAVDGFKEC